MSNEITEVKDSSFEQEVLQSEIPVLIDFWAPWCGPCKSIAPVLEEIASEYAGKVKIVKMNVDDNPYTPSQYNVRGIPNLVFFKAGKVVDQKVGAVEKEKLTEVLDQMV